MNPGAPNLDTAAAKLASSRGVAISFAAQFTRFGLQFVSSVIMARLLMPEEFGVVAMAYPIIAFMQLFVDLGLTQATVQRREISQAELSFMFWICVAASILVGLLVISTAPLAGAFYHEPRVEGVLMGLGAISMLGGFYSQHTALLNRHMRFLPIGVSEVGGYLIGAIAGIVAAHAGCSYWSVVISQGVTTGASMVFTWAFSRWIPSRPGRVTSAKSLLGFGGNITAYNIINYFARNLDNILIGRYLGEYPLGLYDRAYRLLILPLGQVTAPLSRVATPLLARTLHESAEYRHGYARMLETSLLLTYPTVIFAGINRLNLIRTILSEKWIGSAEIFGVLAIGALFAPISNSTGWLLTTQNRTREMRNYGAFSSLAFVLSFVVGLRGGALGVAECYIAVGCVQGPLLWWATTRRGPVSTRDLALMMLPYIIALFPTAFGMALIARFAPDGGVTLALALTIAYLLFAAGLSLTPGGRRALDDVRRQLAGLLAYGRRHGVA
jgi:PST family polysaccharide transporter